MLHRFVEQWHAGIKARMLACRDWRSASSFYVLRLSQRKASSRAQEQPLETKKGTCSKAPCDA